MPQIREGMTKQEVVSILGTPDSFQRSGEYEGLRYTNRLISGWSRATFCRKQALLFATPAPELCPSQQVVAPDGAKMVHADFSGRNIATVVEFIDRARLRFWA
jgi:hypothetical protein